MLNVNYSKYSTTGQYNEFPSSTDRKENNTMAHLIQRISHSVYKTCLYLSLSTFILRTILGPAKRQSDVHSLVLAFFVLYCITCESATPSYHFA
uniref:Uncharacterized protein n=1 Tax=Anguilla anguilla TaxID=7936 RepID=A0A0E9PZF2_ANGAN